MGGDSKPRKALRDASRLPGHYARVWGLGLNPKTLNIYIYPESYIWVFGFMGRGPQSKDHGFSRYIRGAPSYGNYHIPISES